MRRRAPGGEDRLALVASVPQPQSGWPSRSPCRLPRKAPDGRAFPVGLAQVGQMLSAALELTGRVQRNALVIDPQRDRLGDERRLAPIVGDPAHNRVVVWQTQAHVGMAERGEMPDPADGRCRRTRPSSAPTALRASRTEAVAKYTR